MKRRGRLEMTVVEDGERAISRLLDASEGKPDLVIRDLNLLPETELRYCKQSAVLLRCGMSRWPSSARNREMSYKTYKLTAAGVLADVHFTKSPSLTSFYSSEAFCVSGTKSKPQRVRIPITDVDG